MYNLRGQQPTRRWPYIAAVVGVVMVYIIWALARPLPALTPTVNAGALRAKTAAGTLQWPAQGQSAVGIVDSSILEFHGNQQPAPTASTAKLITALTVLAAKPLKPGQQGPTITLSPADVTIYNNYHAQDGSLVKVQAGEKISQYQVLQTLMLPSANNMADSLAIWAFGSLKNYQQAANQYLQDQGLVETHVGNDASGLSPTTTSTARDLVRIGQLTMKEPVLAQIVGQASAGNIPVVGTIKNVNQLLGANGIVGIKTGNSDQAGGVYVSASKTKVNGKEVTIVTAVAGAPGLWEAMNSSLPLIKSAQANFKPTAVVKKGTTVTAYKQPWSGQIAAAATKDLSLNAWGGSTVKAEAHLQNVNSNTHANSNVGTLTVPQSAYNNRLSTPVQLTASTSHPSAWWRLTHPF